MPLPYEPVIGLEIHAQLRTATKIFCGCRTDFGAAPNTHVCPVCLGLPGALPVLNRRAVEMAAQAALALGCEIPPVSVFARKNYFYPDLPKGYQISQYDQPLAVGGQVSWDHDGRLVHVGITRVHLEEDAGKSLHEGFPDSSEYTYLDYNRAGVPLIEIVTEPDLRSAADAAEFFTRLRAILVAIGVNDGNMEEGSLRCDANVSVRARGAATFGTKTEIKNLNSFRFLQKALEFEIDRQADALARGERIVQETRLWDAAAARTASMRSKEEAHDYRYFPEPDLPPVRIDPAWLDAIRTQMPELPEARRERFVSQHGLPEYDAARLAASKPMADYFESVVAACGQPKLASNWILGDLARVLNEQNVDVEHAPVSATRLGELIALLAGGALTNAVAKRVFQEMVATGEAPGAIVDRERASAGPDEAELLATARAVVTEHAAAVAQYRSGKAQAFGFLVGQVMRRAGGKADPARVRAALERVLSEQP